MPIRINMNGRMAPKNRQTVDVAKSAIQGLAPVIQEQFNNSLAVNGYHCTLYHALKHGVVCTCTKSTNTKPDVFDEKGNAGPEYIQSLLTGRKFEVNRYGTMRPDDTTDISKSIGLPDPDTGVTSTELDDAVRELDQAILADEGAPIPVDNTTANACAICFGTGYVGGYYVHQGNRIVLDTTWANLDINGFAVKQDVYPHAFDQLAGNGYIEFSVTLPRGALSLDALRLWNNNQQIASGYQLTVLDNGTWVPLNSLNVLTYCTGLPVRLRVTGTLLTFTHLEIQFNMSSNFLYIEYPRLTQTGDLSVIQAVDAVNLIVSPAANDIQVYDVIADNVFGMRWRITNAQNFYDNNLNPHGWDCNARLVQKLEIINQLVSRALPAQKHTAKFNRR